MAGITPTTICRFSYVFLKVDGINLIVKALEGITFHPEVIVLGSEMNFSAHHQQVRKQRHDHDKV